MAQHYARGIPFGMPPQIGGAESQDAATYDIYATGIGAAALGGIIAGAFVIILVPVIVCSIWKCRKPSGGKLMHSLLYTINCMNILIIKI